MFIYMARVSRLQILDREITLVGQHNHMGPCRREVGTGVQVRERGVITQQEAERGGDRMLLCCCLCRGRKENGGTEGQRV